MAGASDGVRLGAVVDRGLVAERIAARAAPLPAPARRTPDRGPATIPPVAVVVDEIDYGAVEAARTGTGLPLLAFVARAAVDAARAGGPVHLGTASAVVADAGRLRLRALAEAMAGPADAGRGDGKGPAATITLVDAGTTTFTAGTLAPGGGPVLAVGRVDRRVTAWPGPDGEPGLAVRPVGHLALTFDPAVLPAAGAAALLGRVRETLEHRQWGSER